MKPSKTIERFGELAKAAGYPVSYAETGPHGGYIVVEGGIGRGWLQICQYQDTKHRAYWAVVAADKPRRISLRAARGLLIQRGV